MKEDFDSWKSQTWGVPVGCGKLYINICWQDGQVVKVSAFHKSSFSCDATFFESLNRQTTFQTNREIEQTIKDLMGNDDPRLGHFCQKFHAGLKGIIKKGGIVGYSCSDALAKCLEKAIQ